MKRFVRNRKITVSIVLMVMSLCLTAQKAHSNVSISEIMYGSEIRFSPKQWIEISNSGTDTINLTEWTLTIKNVDSEDLLGPVTATINFRDATFDNAPRIWPNDTLMIVTSATDDHSGGFMEDQVYDLRWREDLGISFWTTWLSAEGFYITLTDKDGNLVDEAGNYDGNTTHWNLPYNFNRGRTRAGNRTSLIRRYSSGVPLDGTLKDSWISAVDANLPEDQQTYYGDENDIGSPGVGPIIDMPFVDVPTVTVPTVTVPTVTVPTVDCQVGAVLVPGQSCTYPGTDAKFSVLNNGDGRFLNLTFTALNFRNTNINGRSYTLVANKRNDGSWIIEEVDTVTPPPVNLPVVDCQIGAVLVPGQSCTYPGTDTEFSVLNNGTGQFLDLTFTALNFRNTTINGQSYTLVANKRNDGSWTIEEVGDVTPPPVDLPVVDCQVGTILAPGQSCTYPGTDTKFSVLNNGDGRFLDLTFAALNFRNTTINGQSYTLVANKRNDGSWTIEEVGDVKSPPVDLPVVDCQVGAILAPGQSCTYPGTDTKFSVLNNGNGKFLSFTATEFKLRNTNINGQSYTLVADKRNDGSWKIGEIGAVEESAAVNPRDRKWLLWGQLKANRRLKDSTDYRQTTESVLQVIRNNSQCTQLLGAMSSSLHFAILPILLVSPLRMIALD